MKKDAAKQESSPGLAVAGWPLRRKMALALAIPLLLAATLGGLRVASDLAESSSAGTSAQQVTVLGPAVDYLTAAETAMVAAHSSGSTARGDLVDSIDDIATAAEELEAAAKDAELDDLQSAHVAAILDLSQAMRGQSASEIGPDTWIAQVRQLESGVNQLISAIQAAQSTPEPRLDQLGQALSGRLSLALQQALASDAGSGLSDRQALFSEIGVEAAAIDRLAAALGDSETGVAELRTANNVHAAEVAAGGNDLGGRDAYLPYDEISTNLLDDVKSSLDATASDAQRSALLNAIVTLIALAAAVLLALLVAKLLLDPINRVREGALSVARHKLPDAVARIRAGEEPEPVKPIDVTTNEEIGQVARAVDDLHRQAIHLASGEAQLRQTVNAMFVTLSRRSNSLVNQQLAQIERLEQDEEDPKRLESLFRLDHLASRMRRTADSLLILADAPNRSAGQFTLTVGESLQAATSGVQDYQRVQINSHLGTTISADAAADVVHLLTELVDNALTFSPPAEPVRLNASLGADGVTITISDSGLGMPEAELQQINADLSAEAEATPEAARRMGLFVVSRLANRHGITARLERNKRGNGMTATVILPPAILPEVPGSAAVSNAEQAAAQPTTSTTVESVDTTATTATGTAPAAEAPVSAPESKVTATGLPTRKPATPTEPAASGSPAASQAGDADRPPLEGLLPRREPGANMPRTGADAFLPPETSKASGPLFGKRDKPAVAKDDAPRVASVVPITALASRQRQAASAEAPAEDAVADSQVEETVDETAADDAATEVVSDTTDESPEAAGTEGSAEDAAEDEAAPVATDDPLTAPWQDTEAGPEVAEDESVEEPVAEESVEQEPAVEEPAVEEPAAQADEEPEIEVSADDPLGLGAPAPEEPAAEESAVEEPAAEESAAAEPTVEPVDEPVAAQLDAPAAGVGAGLAGGLPTRSPGAAPEINGDMPGLPGEPLTGARATAGGDSPIFKSMRSGWLAGDGGGEWHETEVEQGWELAETVIEEAAVTESTSAGLPLRHPGERLVPGSVSPPTQTKTRDPEAIRRRLSAHKAGVSRGRAAARNSTQHTEAGPQ
jgi:signal transduction histidine kinase